jgi:hypothetical protein
MVRLCRRIFIVGVLAILLFSLIPRISVLAQQDEGQITIVFDFSHDQLFSPQKRNFTLAIDYLTAQPEYFVRILERGELTAENLTRSHILVVSNPGRNYSRPELGVITDFLAQGGSLFLLGDYQVTERPIGNPLALNGILHAAEVPGIRFTTFVEDNETQGDAIVDPATAQILSYNFEVNETSLSTDISRGLISLGIESLIVAGGSLTTSNPDFVISTGSETSQAISLSGQTISTQPVWLAAFSHGSSSIVLCTSTTMFTDTLCAATNSSWYESFDNALLWSNIIRWMAIPRVQDPTPIMLFFVGIVLLVGIVLFVYSLWLKRRGR